MTQTDPDYDLIKAFVATGNRKAFNRLIECYQDQVYNFCYRFLGCQADAHDCAQEVFVKLFLKLQHFRFESSFSSWLYRIMINTCNEMVRSKQYKSSRNTQPLHAGMGLESGFDHPEKQMMRSEIEQAFQTGLMKLKQVHRLLIIMRDLEGQSYEEIAQKMGMKLGTVRSSLARARQKMADELKEFQDV